MAKIYAKEIKEFGYTFESHVKQKIDVIESNESIESNEDNEDNL